ncbi:MAG: DUF493 domain-containing protein [Bacteroidetes bacterium]|nr:MAG: DUF493 domain-containing protein [Bacteroidota bacterium]
MVEDLGKYGKLFELLVRDFTWPTDYMFKFIVPFEADNLNTLKSFFSDKAEIKHKESKNGKYISFSAVQKFDDPMDIIDIYKKAEGIKKLISL